MTKGLQTSGLSMYPKTQRLEVIANNLANINTTGFKKSDLFIRELIKADISLRGNNLPEANIEQLQKINFSQGSLTETKNPFDLAISGKGFFTIETPQGIMYTRNGNFTVSPEGFLVTQQGYRVLSNKGAVLFPNPVKTQSNQVNISSIGEISIGREKLGKLQIVEFSDQEINKGLKSAGENLFVAKDDFTFDIIKNRECEIFQGYLENSNVNSLEEMVKMIELNTAIQTDQKSIRYQDQTLQLSNEMSKI